LVRGVGDSPYLSDEFSWQCYPPWRPLLAKNCGWRMPTFDLCCSAPVFFHIEIIFNRQKKEHSVGFQASHRFTQLNDALKIRYWPLCPALPGVCRAILTGKTPSLPLVPVMHISCAHEHPIRQSRTALKVFIQTAADNFLASHRAKTAARMAHLAATRSSACNPPCSRKVVVHLSSRENSSVAGALALNSMAHSRCGVRESNYDSTLCKHALL